MKPKHQITPAAPDWTRAKGLLAELKSAVRRSLSAQVLLGKELSSIKKRLGFIQGRHIITRQIGGSSKTWDQWCQDELKIPARTADRWIQCFAAALKKAKARKAKEPKACRLLEIPADELTGDELAALAEVIQGLVDGDTQAGLLEELRIVKPANPTSGGDTSNKSGNGDQVAFEQMVFDLFSEITSGFGQLEKKIFRGRSRAEFQAMLEWIPLASDDKNSPCLYAIRDSLRGVLDGELPKMIEAVESTIREKERPGMPAKRGRGKLTNA